MKTNPATKRNDTFRSVKLVRFFLQLRDFQNGSSIGPTSRHLGSLYKAELCVSHIFWINLPIILHKLTDGPYIVKIFNL